MTGWIKIYRSLLYWEWSDVPEMFALWVRIIIKATHEDTEWHGITIKRGQFVTTLAKLAAESGMTLQQVRTCIDRLKASNQITTQTTNKYTIVNVCKYEDYQDTADTEQQTNGKQTTHKQQTNNTQATNQQQQDKNIRIQEELINNPLTPLQGESPEPTISEKEKQPRKEKPAARAVTRYDRLWEEIFQKLTNDTFVWSKRENVAVQAIVGKIVKMMEDAGHNPTEQEKENGLRWFVTSLYEVGDDWVRANFTPHVICDKFNEFYQTIKIAKRNGKQRTTNGNPTGVSAEYLAKVAEELAH